VTSVAYSGQTDPPGWIAATLALVMGWLSAALALLVLYVAASFVGAISQPYAWSRGAINEWSYAENGTWSILANTAVILIGLVLATVATSWWLRRAHAPVSDGRLATVLFFVGGIPLVTARPWLGVFGFLVALVLVRGWVGRDDRRLAPRRAAVLVAVLAIVVASYGLLHPLWTTGAVPAASVGRYCSILVNVHNAAHAGVTVDRIDATSITESPARPGRLRLAPGANGKDVVRYLGGSGTGEFDLHADYHVFGLALGETLPFRVRLRSNC